jgi:hypothetical protein
MPSDGPSFMHAICLTVCVCSVSAFSSSPMLVLGISVHYVSQTVVAYIVTCG